MKVNRYPGPCRYCGARVARNAGDVVKINGRWAVGHLACADADGGAVDVFWIGENEYTRNKAGRCIDAPCCGCCTI